MCASVAVALAVAACGGSSPKVVTPTVTVPPARSGSTVATSATSATSVTSATGSTSPADALAADQGASALAQTASTAAVSYGNNNNGNYAAMTPAALQSLDASIQVGPGNGNPYLANPGGVTVLDNGAGYTVTATSTTGDTFSVGESATGTPTQSCTGAISTLCETSSTGGGTS